MANEYTHVVQAKSKAGDWKSMTKHTSHADAKSSLADAKTASKGKGDYRIVPFSEHKNPNYKATATKPVNKTAPKKVAK